MNRRLFLVRHGRAAFDEDDYDRLSPLGRRQAVALGVWWREALPLPTECWTGGMRRQIETAEAWSRALVAVNDAQSAPDAQPGASRSPAGASVALSPGATRPPVLRCEPRLREFDHREIFYRHRPDLLDPAALAQWKTQAADHGEAFEATWQAALARWLSGSAASEYAESWPQFRRRCLDGLAAVVVAGDPAATTVVFTSSGPLAAVLQRIDGCDDACLPGLQSGLFNTGVTEIAVNGDWTVLRRNACDHLADAPDLLSLR